MSRAPVHVQPLRQIARAVRQIRRRADHLTHSFDRAFAYSRRCLLHVRRGEWDAAIADCGETLRLQVIGSPHQAVLGTLGKRTGRDGLVRVSVGCEDLRTIQDEMTRGLK